MLGNNATCGKNSTVNTSGQRITDCCREFGLYGNKEYTEPCGHVDINWWTNMTILSCTSVSKAFFMTPGTQENMNFQQPEQPEHSNVLYNMVCCPLNLILDFRGFHHQQIIQALKCESSACDPTRVHKTKPLNCLHSTYLCYSPALSQHCLFT